jgi:hypothetical protein
MRSSGRGRCCWGRLASLRRSSSCLKAVFRSSKEHGETNPDMQGYKRKNHRRARRQTRGVKTLISPPSLHKVLLYPAVYDHGYCFRALVVVIGPSL